MEHPRPRGSGFATPRRVFTAPAPAPAGVPPPVPHAPSSRQPAGSLVDTLYEHPNVKIVLFTAGARTLSLGPRPTAGPSVEPGSLSWSSQLERTIAVGAFRIYRAPGSVAFLSCGSALKPILPKSQAWCVDEESSKFVLQIRRPQYWRIEVPLTELGDVERARRLREVFDAILQFEKTECPFKRSFTVELPEQPQTPARRRPWTPVRRSSASLPLTPITPVETAEIARLHIGTPRGSICMGDLRLGGHARKGLAEHTKGLDPPPERQIPRENGQLPAASEPQDGTAPLILQSGDHKDDSSVALSQQTIAISVPQLEVTEPGPADVTFEIPRFGSPTESLESFNNPESWRSTPLPPSPPLSNPGSPWTSARPSGTQDIPETPVTCQDASDQTITSNASETWSVATAESFPSDCSITTAPSLHETDCSPTCSRQSPERSTLSANPQAKEEREILLTTGVSNPSPIRRASTISSSISPSRRALSPLPPPANLFIPPPHRQPNPTQIPDCRDSGASTSATTRTGPDRSTGGALAAAVRRLPLTVLHKTCEILLSPPSHLLSLMLRVAARITAGEWRGLVFGLGEGGERVSVQWDWSEDEDENENEAAGYRRGGLGVGCGYGYPSGYGSGHGWGLGGGGRTSVFDESFSLRNRGRVRRKGTKLEMKMAGSFPESDDDEDEEDHDQDEDQLGPMDQPPSRSRSRGRLLRGEAAAGRAAAAVMLSPAPAEVGDDKNPWQSQGGDKDPGPNPGPGADADADAAEWGVD